MKIKDDIVEKWDEGWTIYDIAEAYNCSVEAIIFLLDIQESPFKHELH